MFDSLADEVQVCEAIGRLVERPRPIGISARAAPLLRDGQRLLDQVTRRRVSLTADTVDFRNVTLGLDENDARTDPPICIVGHRQSIPRRPARWPKAGKLARVITEFNGPEKISVAILSIVVPSDRRYPPY